MPLHHKVKLALPLLRHPHLAFTYAMMRPFTMIPPNRYVANLQLARAASGIPGAIVECGTWKGGMIAGIARLLGTQREYYLFDSFEGLPPAEDIDGTAAKAWQANTTSPGYHDNCKASIEDALAAMRKANVTNAHLIKGWFEDTLHKASFPGGISILRMDADWYSSTFQILDNLFPLVNEGGLILVDDYFTWDGCSKAIHDYLSKHKRPERISTHEGVCYIRKKATEQEPETTD